MWWRQLLSGVDRETRLIWLFLCIATFLRLGLAASLPLTPDEAYYWVWSRHLQLSYLDHPPMVAIWIRIGTTLLGQNALGVRWLGPVSTLVGSVALHQAARDFWPRQTGSWRAVALLNATLMLGIGAATMTPDTPTVFFLTIALWALGRLIRTGLDRWWLVIGGIFGLAFDSKYTAALPAMACALWWISDRSRWRQAFSVITAGILALVLMSPVMIWNATHDWASFLKQGGRTGDWHPARALQFLGELLGGQIGLATPLIFILFVIGTWRVARLAVRNQEERLLAFMILIPCAVFVQHAFGGRVQANWPVVIYPALALAAASTSYRIGAACGLGVGLTLLVYLQAAFSIVPLSAHHDVIARQARGWEQLGKDLAHTVPTTNYIAVNDYAVASELAFYGKPLAIYGADRRWGYFALSQRNAGEGVLLVREKERPDVPSDWQLGESKGLVCRYNRQAIMACYRLWALKAPEDAAWRPVKLPSP
ncbi:hypothetical protein A0U89_08110 [Kozakia baliensis]|uniref:Glycosyltransferase RgtA/B/C/D-like domain-containing protein n=1 Tax=Kozakia baliensis TaxID=153496 RepID=A0A1D8UTX9_9PROT|nr:hypothetical protein A0U89_08110 [Kozakia baliensis]